MKKILFSALMACFAMTASAQISEGAPSAKKYATGNRPTKGTFGLYVGAETDLFQDKLGTKDEPNIQILPIVNLKYMATDNFELRLGMRFWKQRESLKGTMDEAEGVKAETQGAKWVQSDNQFRPGFAYHFTKSNLLDVYAGMEGILGWKRNTITANSEIDGVKSYANTRSRNIQFGANAFIGLQVFIARLPLALGVEYGFGTMWDGALKTRSSAKSGDNDAVVTYTYDSDPTHNDAFKNAKITSSQAGVSAWDGLKARKGAWGSQARVTLSYYFNR